MPASREMTLEEYMAQLPTSHRARKEYMALRSPAPGAEAMREALIEVAARARMNFITTDEAWADRHQPCPLTKIVTPIVDDWLKRHHLPAPGAAEMREALYCTLCGRETPHAPVPDPNPPISTATSIPACEAPARPHCELCGELMPPGEEMFKYHGASGPCPTMPLPAREVPEVVRAWAASYDDEATAGAHHLAVDDALRDWIRKEYGI